MFADKFLRLAVTTDHNSTYKLATAIALLQVAQETTTRDDSLLLTRRVAEVVIDLYWMQLPFDSAGAALRQMNRVDQSSRIVDAVSTIRDAEGGRHTAHPPVGSALFATKVADVERALLSYPLRLLQSPADQFLFAVPFPSKRSPAAFGADFEGSLKLKPGVLELLQLSAGLLRPLIEAEWVRKVARYNGRVLDETALRHELFGYTRVAWPTGLREALQDLQPKCFYCGGPLPRRTATSALTDVPTATHIDHFIPWARSLNDAIENLVLADGRCNLRKSDHLCDFELVHRWVQRLRAHRSTMEEIAAKTAWQTDARRTVAIAVAQYRASSKSELGLVWGAAGLQPVDVGPARLELTQLLDEIPNRGA